MKLNLPSPGEVDRMSYRELFRSAAEQGLIEADTVKDWLVYRDKRNLTSNTDNAEIAASVYASLPQFARHAHALLQSLDQRVAQDA